MNQGPAPAQLTMYNGRGSKKVKTFTRNKIGEDLDAPNKWPYSPLENVEIITILAARWHAVQSFPGDGVDLDIHVEIWRRQWSLCWCWIIIYWTWLSMQVWSSCNWSLPKVLLVFWIHGSGGRALSMHFKKSFKLLQECDMWLSQMNISQVFLFLHVCPNRWTGKIWLTFKSLDNLFGLYSDFQKHLTWNCFPEISQSSTASRTRSCKIRMLTCLFFSWSKSEFCCFFFKLLRTTELVSSP